MLNVTSSDRFVAHIANCLSCACFLLKKKLLKKIKHLLYVQHYFSHLLMVYETLIFFTIVLIFFSSIFLFYRTANNVNGSVRRHSPAVSPSHHSHGGGGGGGGSGGGGRPASLMDSTSNHHHPSQTSIVRVVVNKDERGYGMKVSGDNPVYVQSVKEGKLNSFYFGK